MQDDSPKEPSDTMLYVSNLPFSFGDEDLQGVFAEFEVTSAYVATRRNGRSKGFGFVSFSSEDAQQKALTSVDGKELDGRTLTVKVAHKDERRGERGELKEEFRTEQTKPKRGPRRRKAEVVKEPSPTILYVSNLPFEFNDSDLQEIFAEFNPVSANIARRHDDRSKGYGFVNFPDHAAQQAALEKLDNHQIDDRVISVKVSIVPVAGQEEKSQEPSDTTLYVSNLPFTLEDDGLAELFANNGHPVVSARVATRRNGRSKGFGFVTFAGSDEQQAAEAALNGFEVEDRAIAVKIALKGSENKPEDQAPRKEKKPREKKVREKKAPAERKPSETLVYVANLAFEVDDDALAGLFEGFEIKSAHVATRRNGRSKGFGFVEFSSHAEQVKALEKNGSEFQGRTLAVEIAQETVQENTEENNNN